MMRGKKKKRQTEQGRKRHENQATRRHIRADLARCQKPMQFVRGYLDKDWLNRSGDFYLFTQQGTCLASDGEMFAMGEAGGYRTARHITRHSTGIANGGRPQRPKPNTQGSWRPQHLP